MTKVESIAGSMPLSLGAKTQRKYEYAMEALDTAMGANSVRVRAKLTGSFTGSPIELDYLFRLRDDKIISLKIE